MNLDHELRRGTRLLVQAVDVLRDDRVQLAVSLQLDQRSVPGVGLGRPRGRSQPVLPGPPSHLGVRHVVLERGHLFGFGILRPYALGTAKVGYARLGGDPRTGEHHHLLRLADPRARDPERLFEVRLDVCHRHILTALWRSGHPAPELGYPVKTAG